MRRLFNREQSWTPFLMTALGIAALSCVHSHPETAATVIQIMTIIAGVIGISRHITKP